MSLFKVQGSFRVYELNSLAGIDFHLLASFPCLHDMEDHRILINLDHSPCSVLTKSAFMSIVIFAEDKVGAKELMIAINKENSDLSKKPI